MDPNPYSSPSPVSLRPESPADPPESIKNDLVSPWLCWPAVVTVMTFAALLFCVVFSSRRSLSTFAHVALWVSSRCGVATAAWCLFFHWYHRGRIVRPACLALGGLSGATLGFLVASDLWLLWRGVSAGLFALPGILGGSLAARMLPTVPLPDAAER
ncbi:MAG: hypothetical protein NXI04_21100 [Planctomycetaceae bacterium]|nr:hypothetical protein [Planctomycetaceae bacterium]